MGDNFINIQLHSSNVDVYYVRSSIFSVIEVHSGIFNGKLLDVGCGQMPYRDWILNNTSVTEYIGLDLEGNKYSSTYPPDLLWNGIQIPLHNNTIDTVFSTEVLEHVPTTDQFLSEIFRVLKPGGVFFFTVPFLWPLHDKPYDEYRFTPFSLSRYLKAAGFREENITLKALGGWDASLAQMLGLWVNRRPMSPKKRKWLSKLIFPIYKKLIARDYTKESAYDEEMITGLVGLVKKQ